MSGLQADPSGPSQEMVDAMRALWKLEPPGPENFFANPAFLRLRDACGKLHPHTRALGFQSTLMTALVTLGLPCRAPRNSTGTFAQAEDAARALHQAFGSTHSKRTHLVPLDLADDLPSLRFGTAHLKSVTAAELRGLFDEQGLNRTHHAMEFQAEQFAEFQWLVVEEISELERTDGARALPDLLMDFGQDFGRIEPHQGQVPRIVVIRHGIRTPQMG